MSKIRVPFFPKKKASPWGCFWKKNPKISEISNLESDFFPTFQRKSRMFQIIRNLFCLNYIWANFEQDQRRFFSKIFQLGIGFFSNFPTKVANVPNNSKFILSELHLSEVWARLEDLFFRKKRPPQQCVFEKKFKKFPKFPTWNRIFF